MSLLLNKKEQILKEYYFIDSPLNIRQISGELGISNSPVREALLPAVLSVYAVYP